MLVIAIFLSTGVTVTLPAEARVRGTELFVGSVATVRGDDPAAVARVQAVSLGYAPAPGHTRILQPLRIEQQIAAAVCDCKVTLDAHGPLRIVPETEVVSAARIEQAARAAIEQSLAQELGTPGAVLRRIEPIADLEIPAGTASHALEGAPLTFGSHSGLLRVPVRVLVDGVLHRTLWTSWQLEVFEVRPVLTRPVRAGETIEAALLVEARVPRAAGGPAALERAMLLGTSAKRDLSAGVALTDLDVLRPTLIERGDTLILEVRKGQVAVRVSAIAQQSGRLGDSILVEVPSGQGGHLSGTIVSKQLVAMDLTRKD
jgi:flagella basal body P-ring formation protein FlgA